MTGERELLRVAFVQCLNAESSPVAETPAVPVSDIEEYVYNETASDGHVN